MRKKLSFGAALLTILLFAAACGGDSTDDAGSDNGSGSDSDSGGFAMIMNGPVSDADYNALGFEAVEAIGEALDIRSEYSELVDVTDADRTAREYINDDFDIIAFHSGLYIPIALELANEFPDVTFIVESGGPMEDQPENVWNIGRAYYTAFYALGGLAAMASETGTVAFLGPIADFPDGIRSANSFFDGARSVDPDIKLLHTFAGDFADPVKGRQAAESLINEDADVLATFLNQAILGVAEATEKAGQPTLFTALYTDKQELAPDNYVTSPIFDFASIFTQVVEEIQGGVRTGYLQMDPSTDGIVLGEIYNVSDEVAEKTKQLYDDIASGEVEIPTPSAEAIEVPE